MDVIWIKFNCMVDGSKVTAQSNHIGRMKQHYEKYVKQPRSSEPQQDAVCDLAPVPLSQPMPAQQAKRPAALQFGPDPPPAKKRQADLNSHVVRTPAATKDDLDDQVAEFLYEEWTPAATKDDLDDQVAEFLYGCSLPFSIIEHPLFKSLVSSLRPGYQPPSRQALGNKLLDKCHDPGRHEAASQQQDRHHGARWLELSPEQPSHRYISCQ